MYIRPILSVFSSPLPISVRFTLPRRFPAYRSFYLDNPTYRRGGGGRGGVCVVAWPSFQSLLSSLLSNRQSRNTPHTVPPRARFPRQCFWFWFIWRDRQLHGITEGCTATEIINSCNPPPLLRHGTFEKSFAPGDLRSIRVPSSSSPSSRSGAPRSSRVFAFFSRGPSVDRSNGVRWIRKMRVTGPREPGVRWIWWRWCGRLSEDLVYPVLRWAIDSLVEIRGSFDCVLTYSSHRCYYLFMNMIG